MGREKNIQTSILNYASTIGLNLWRNNRGLFLTLDGSRKTRAGLEIKGSSDLIGIYNGKFLAVEVKSLNGRPSKEQVHFINLIKFNGGIAGVCRNIEDFKKLIDVRDS